MSDQPASGDASNPPRNSEAVSPGTGLLVSPTEQGSEGGSARPPTVDEPGALAFGELFRGWSIDAIQRTPPELADAAEVVVLGSLASVSDSRTYGREDDEVSYVKNVMVEITATEVLAGELPSDVETVFLELEAPGQWPEQTYEDAFPRGASTIAYLYPGSSGGGIGDDIIGVDPAWPGDDEVFQLAGPRGFAIEAADGVVAIPFFHHTDATLEDFLPSSQQFPD